MIYTIQNKCLSVSVRTHGAELCSVRDVRSGREFLWQGDESVWNGQSPLLFPNVGRIRAGKCKFRGQDYPLPMHGFANRMEFELEALEPERICLFLRDTEETRRVYPFSFALRVEFFLNDDALTVRHTVYNTDSIEMPFCIGAHPGFFCEEGDELLLDAPEDLTLYRLDAERDLLGTVARPYPVPKATISLSHTLFQDDAMIFDEIASRSITLSRKDGSCVRVEYADAPCVGIWSRGTPPLRYVCIEPWHGMDDPVNASGIFTDKAHCHILSPGESFVFPIRILPKSFAVGQA